MSISCDCSVDVDEVAEFYSESYPVAKKAHTCCECKGDINIGDKYHKVTGKWEGNFSTYKTCMTCDNIRNHYCSSGFYFGSLREQIRECVGFDYTKVPEEDD